MDNTLCTSCGKPLSRFTWENGITCPYCGKPIDKMKNASFNEASSSENDGLLDAKVGASATETQGRRADATDDSASQPTEPNPSPVDMRAESASEGSGGLEAVEHESPPKIKSRRAFVGLSIGVVAVIAAIAVGFGASKSGVSPGKASTGASKAPAQRPTATEIVNRSDFGDFPCTYPTLITTCYWNNTDYPMNGITITHKPDALMVSIDFGAIAPDSQYPKYSSYGAWRVYVMVAFTDENGSYVAGECWEIKNTSGKQNDVSYEDSIQNWSASRGSGKNAATQFESYVVRIEFENGLSWGASRNDLQYCAELFEAVKSVKYQKGLSWSERIVGS